MESSFKAVRRPETNRVPCNACTAIWPLRDEHSSDRIRLVALLPERKRQFAKPPLHPICLDVRKILTVAPGERQLLRELAQRRTEPIQDARCAGRRRRRGTERISH